MRTLSNVTTRRGEPDPLSVRLTPDALPEAKKSSQTGVSVRYAPSSEEYGSINGAEIDDQAITHEHVEYLRDKYLWHKDVCAPIIAIDGSHALPFPYFLGMVPWGHHIEILQSCKDVKEAVFYVEKTIQNNNRYSDLSEGEPREVTDRKSEEYSTGSTYPDYLKD